VDASRYNIHNAIKAYQAKRHDVCCSYPLALLTYPAVRSAGNSANVLISQSGLPGNRSGVWP